MANQIPVDWKLRRDAMARANAIRQGQGVTADYMPARDELVQRLLGGQQINVGDSGF